MSKKFLRRYTNIPSLLYLLRERKITLLDPATWDDKNDSYYLSIYREKKELKCVLALCFTQVPETYHHWRVFADGSAGVAIAFDREILLKALRKKSAVTLKNVEYLTLKKMESKKLKISELPFLKRAPYVDECEFHVIFESKITKRSSLDVPIPLGSINKITLSPWIPRALAIHVKKTIQAIDGCQDLTIVRSTLISNEQWKSYGEAAH